jgi:hypothetical protein
MHLLWGADVGQQRRVVQEAVCSRSYGGISELHTNRHRRLSMSSDPLTYLWMDKNLLVSDAFRTLTKTAMLVLFDFHGKKRVHGRGEKRKVLNNGDFLYSYNEAKKKGISGSAFMNAIDQLIERGFLYVAEQGGGMKGHPSRYGLSSHWRQFGSPAFKALVRKKRCAQYPNAGFQKGHRHYGRCEEDVGTYGDL